VDPEEIAGAVGGDVTENLRLLDELISKNVARSIREMPSTARE
jgi:hypothetical protein